MKNIFIVTDNKYIYEEFDKILKNKNILIDYFCSHKSIKNFSLEISAKKITPLDLKDSDNDEMLINGYDLGLSCHSKQLFSAKLVNSIKCINIHPGLNPFNRGWFPQVFSILNKFPIGATIHIMDEKIDHGNIIAQEEVQISTTDLSIDLYNKVQRKEIKLFNSYIDDILNNTYDSSQPKSEGNYNSIQDYNKLCQIDLDKKVTMKEAIDYFRAMTHPPYKNSYFIDENGNKIFISIELKKECS